MSAFVARAQNACCAPVEAPFPGVSGPNDFEASILRSFHSEWRRQQCERPLKSIAIVDDDPDHQYLYPEFVLFERMFKRHGLEAVIVPPQKLEHRSGRLMYGGLAIDLVYNRLTDFSLEAPEHGAILTAYLSGDARRHAQSPGTCHVRGQGQLGTFVGRCYPQGLGCARRQDQITRGTEFLARRL